MRLLKFLQEATFTNIELKHLLNNECSNFLRILPKGKCLWRGEDRSLLNGNCTKIFTRSSRDKTTCYNLINDWLVKNGYCSRTKDVMFCTSNFNWAGVFGERRVVFPAGNIKFTYVKSEDFNKNNQGYFPELLNWCVRDEIYKLADTDWRFTDTDGNVVPLDELQKPSKLKILVPFHNGMVRKISRTVEEYFNAEKKVKSYFVNNTNLEEAIKSKYEIWFNCSYYYSVELFSAYRFLGIH